MSTKSLAKELGLIRRRRHPSVAAPSARKQHFSFLIVIDFESTCWKEKNNFGQEIIEFPAVLLDVASGAVESEFHSYVQPQEHPHLSSFCTELTGITQDQVDSAPPLHVCLSRFRRWLHGLQQERGVAFETDSSGSAPCAVVTWSDWDLGVCLLYECKRKQLSVPDALKSWIDLRATYRLFYNRKPKGLRGALLDLGLTFTGREHSGLVDARNTALLAKRMASDGCLLTLTRSLRTAPLKSKAPYGISSERPALRERQQTSVCERRQQTSVCERSGQQTSVCERKQQTSVCEQRQQTSVCERRQQTSVCERSGQQTSVCDQREQTSVCERGQQTSVCEQRQQTSVCERKQQMSVCERRGQQTSVCERRQQTSVCERRQQTSVCDQRQQMSVYQALVSPRTVLSSTNTPVCVRASTSLTHLAGLSDTTYDPETPDAHWGGGALLSEEAESVSYDDVTIEAESVSYDDVTIGAEPDETEEVGSLSCNDVALGAGPDKSKEVESVSYNNVPVGAGPDKSEEVESVSCNNVALGAGPDKSEEVESVSYNNVSVGAGPGMSVPSRTGSNWIKPSRAPSSVKTPNPFAPLACFLGRSAPFSVYREPKATAPLCGCGRRARRLTVANGGPNQDRRFFSCPVRRQSCGFFQWESGLTRRNKQC